MEEAYNKNGKKKFKKHGQHFKLTESHGIEQKIIIKVKLCLKLQNKKNRAETNTKVLDMHLWYKAAKKHKKKKLSFRQADLI